MARYLITYASRGRMPDMSGQLRVFVDAARGPCPTIICRDGSAVVLDPRAVIRVAGGGIVYTPRNYPLDTHTKDMREWLVNHPDWGKH